MDKTNRILDADFITSIYDYAAVAEYDLPQCAIVGRSNVGKSTLVNALCAKKSLAETSKTPGRTQGINVYKLRIRQSQTESEQEEEKFFHLMDLPGYGYAAAAKAVRQKWELLLGSYIEQAPLLRAIVLLCDVRREPDDLERWFLEANPQARIIVAITKCDKLSKQELSKRGKIIAEELGVSPASLLYTAAGRKKEGISQLVNSICNTVFDEYWDDGE